MKNIVLIGIMGCGKTTISKLLAKKLHRPVIDIDDFVVEKYQMSINDMFKISENYFREKEAICCAIAGDREGTIISTGGGVIKNPENIKALAKNSVIIYIDRPIENILTDIDAKSRPLIKDGPEKLYALHEERHQKYIDACDIRIENLTSLDDIVNKIIEETQDL